MAEEAVLPSKDPEGSGTPSVENPTLKDLEELLNTGRPSCNHVDEVWPNLFLGDQRSYKIWDRIVILENNTCLFKKSFLDLMVMENVTTHSRFGLWKMGISHVLNAANSTLFCQEPHDFFGTTIEYHGVPAHDLPEFDISSFFYSAAEFIHKALNTPGGKILVHCAVGISRSSSLVLAYLMIYHNLSLVKAIETVKEHRWIFPNEGFLKQLKILDMQLRKH